MMVSQNLTLEYISMPELVSQIDSLIITKPDEAKTDIESTLNIYRRKFED
jgi:hypothetical protein